MTDPRAWRQAKFHLLRLQLLSLSVPDGVDLTEAASKVRAVRERVIVHRDHRDALRRSIERHGWHYAVTRVPQGSKSSEFGILMGWSWHHPDLPGTFIQPSNPLIADVSMLKGKQDRKGQ